MYSRKPKTTTYSPLPRYRAAILLVVICGSAVAFNARAESYAAPVLTPPARTLNRVELTGQGGYRFGGSADGENGGASLEAGPVVGGTLGIRVRGNALAIASYYYQFSRADVHFDAVGDEDTSFDMAIGYLQFGGEIEFPVRPKAVPFMGMTLGTVHFTPEVDDSTTDWYFAFALFGGIKIPLTKHFGLRADFKLLVTILNNDSDSLCVSGKGCITALDVNAMAQGEGLGGAYLAF